jgi:hypothetical protein
VDKFAQHLFRTFAVAFLAQKRTQLGFGDDKVGFLENG